MEPKLDLKPAGLQIRRKTDPHGDLTSITGAPPVLVIRRQGLKSDKYWQSQGVPYTPRLPTGA